MFGYFWFAFVLILVVRTASASDECKYRVVFDYVSTKSFSSAVIEEVNAVLVQLNNRSYISGNLVLRTDVNKLRVTSTMDLWRNDRPKVRLFNLNMDACAFLSMMHKNSFLGTLAKSFKKYTNAKLICPLREKFNYTLTKWYLDEHDLPAFAPAGSFQTFTEYFIEKTKMLRIIVQGRIVYN